MARAAKYLPDSEDALYNPAYPSTIEDSEETGAAPSSGRVASDARPSSVEPPASQDSPVYLPTPVTPAELAEDTSYIRALQQRDPSLVPDAVPTVPGESAKDAAFIANLTGIQERYSSTIDENSKRFNDLVTRDRQQMEEQYRRQQFAAGAMPAPWQADKERAERIRGPFENFGSFATVFGMFASMATRTPLTSALNAGAAAMTAIRNSDEKAYESAYEAWQNNVNLAVKQFDIENKMFDNAKSMITTDLASWRAVSLANEASFNNKKALLFLENGMYPEYIQAKEAQAKSMVAIKEAQYNGMLFDIRKDMISIKNEEFEKAHPNASPSDRVMFRLQTAAEITQGKTAYEVAEQEAAAWTVRYMQEHGVVPPHEERRQVLKDVLAGRYIGRGSQVDQAVWDGYYQEALGKNMPDHEARAYATKKEAESHSRAVPRAPAPNRLGTEAEFIEKGLPEYTKPVAEGGKGMSDKDARIALGKEWAARKQVFTAKQAAEQQERVDVIDNSMKIFDKAENLINKRWGLPGSTGYARRAAETVGNLLGNGTTDANMFAQYIEELQLFAQKALLGREGRPLSAEAGKMDAIIKGFSLTDTTANTKKSFEELRKLYKTVRQQVITRLNQEWTPDKSGQPAPAASSPQGGGNWYENVPGYKP